MTTILNINREIEHIIIPVTDGDDVDLEIFTDDKSIEKTLAAVGNAMDRFAALQNQLDTAPDQVSEDKARSAMAHLFERTISAIVGVDGWTAILVYIGNGEQADPTNNIITLGEVFAALVTWLYNRCSSKQLRSAGIYFNKEKSKGNIVAVKPRKKSGKRK